MSKSEIPKDWFLVTGTTIGRKRINAAIEKRKVSSPEELPNLMTVEEASVVLKTKKKTVADWMARKILRSVKLQRRRFTTPQWIQEFIEHEMVKHG